MAPISRFFRRAGDTKQKDGDVLLSQGNDQNIQRLPVTGISDSAPSMAANNPFLAWYLELLAISTTIGCVIAIAVLLRKMDGRPLANWNFEASFNTVIAVLGTICRTTLAFAVSACIGQQKWGWFRRQPGRLSTFEIFDQATRGPWGATKLMFLLNLRHWATIGALVTVGSLAFEPTLQASIGNVGKSQNSESGSQALVGRATQLDFGSIDMSSAMIYGRRLNDITSKGFHVHLDWLRLQPDLGFASAVFNAFNNPTTPLDRQVAFTCETGNCTWTQYSSLGICSSCADVSKHMKRSNGEQSNGTNIPLPQDGNGFSNYGFNFTRYSLPYAHLSNFDWNQYHSASPISTLMVVNTTASPSQTISFRDKDTLLVSILMIKGAPEYISGNSTWKMTRPAATECALYLCVKTYQSDIVQGILKEQVKSSWAFRRNTSFQTIPVEMNNLNSTIAEIWTAENPELYETTFQRTDLQITGPKQDGDHQEYFNITHASLATMITILLETIGGSSVSRQVSFPGGINYDGKIDYDEALSGPLAFAGALFKAGNNTKTVDQVAQSLTNYVRSNATMAYAGFTLDWVLYVEVKWGFFALPLVFTVLGCIYVFLTIFESCWFHLPVWTNNALPALVYGLDDKTQRLLRPLYETRKGEKEIERRYVKFSKEEEGLRLIE